jgi:hypothetical protein
MMAIAYHDLDLYQGSIFQFTINVKSGGFPVDLTGKTFRLKINNRSAAPLIDLDASRFVGENGAVSITIKSEDTVNVEPFDDATWDCFYTVSGTEKQLIGHGRATLKAQT